MLQVRRMDVLMLLSRVGMWVMLDYWCSTLDTKLVVGSVDELVLVRVVLNSALPVAVMHWKAVHLVMSIWTVLSSVLASVAVVTRIEVVLVLVAIVVSVVVVVLFGV